jgi:hypothetical protein
LEIHHRLSTAPTVQSPTVCETPKSGRKSWPLEYTLPSTFSPSVMQSLTNNVNLEAPQNRTARGEFIRSIVDDALLNYTIYPDKAHKTDMAKAIIKQYPHLREDGGRGYDG